MTRHRGIKSNGMLCCTISAIMDVFEMTNKREPTKQEVNHIITTAYNLGSRIK